MNSSQYEVRLTTWPTLERFCAVCHPKTVPRALQANSWTIDQCFPAFSWRIPYLWKRTEIAAVLPITNFCDISRYIWNFTTYFMFILRYLAESATMFCGTLLERTAVGTWLDCSGHGCDIKGDWIVMFMNVTAFDMQSVSSPFFRQVCQFIRSRYRLWVVNWWVCLVLTVPMDHQFVKHSVGLSGITNPSVC